CRRRVAHFRMLPECGIVPVIGCAEGHPSKTDSGVNVFRGDGGDGVPAGGREAPERGVARLSPRNSTAEDASGRDRLPCRRLVPELCRGPPPTIFRIVPT